MGNEKLRVLDLFSGIGGFSLGLERRRVCGGERGPDLFNNSITSDIGITITPPLPTQQPLERRHFATPFSFHSLIAASDSGLDSSAILSVVSTGLAFRAVRAF
jgi:hypothetical protein